MVNDIGKEQVCWHVVPGLKRNYIYNPFLRLRHTENPFTWRLPICSALDVINFLSRKAEETAVLF